MFPKMKAAYDSDEDILHLLASGKKVKESIEVADEIVIDIDKSNNIIGIQLFDAHALLSKLNKRFNKKMIASIEFAKGKLVRFRNYAIIMLVFHAGNEIIEEKLPAFSLGQYESPLVRATAV